MANPEKLRTPQSVQTKVLLLNAKGFSNRRIARDLGMRPYLRCCTLNSVRVMNLSVVAHSGEKRKTSHRGRIRLPWGFALINWLRDPDDIRRCELHTSNFGREIDSR